jgi:hypothetical protein
MEDRVGEGPAGTRSTAMGRFQHMGSWSRISIVGVRIAFGGIWAWNALRFAQYLTTNASTAYVRQVITSSQRAGQHISLWGDFWQHVATWHPAGFILICVVGMGLVACGLLFGLLTNLACGIGSVGVLFFWSTQLVSLVPAGIQAGDTGMLLVFLLAFLGFILSGAGQMFGADRILANRMGHWAFLVVGKTQKVRQAVPHYEQVQWRKVESPIDVSRANGLHRTRTMNDTRIYSIYEKEVVGLYKGRFNTK